MPCAEVVDDVALEDACLILDVVNGLVHEGLDEFVIFFGILHRSEVEHQLHVFKVGRWVESCGLDSDVSVCLSRVGPCEDYVECLLAHVDVVSENVKGLTDDLSDEGLHGCLSNLLGEDDSRKVAD